MKRRKLGQSCIGVVADMTNESVVNSDHALQTPEDSNVNGVRRLLKLDAVIMAIDILGCIRLEWSR
jgi:hypothetical protein